MLYGLSSAAVERGTGHNSSSGVGSHKRTIQFFFNLASIFIRPKGGRDAARRAGDLSPFSLRPERRASVAGNAGNCLEAENLRRAALPGRARRAIGHEGRITRRGLARYGSE